MCHNKDNKNVSKDIIEQLQKENKVLTSRIDELNQKVKSIPVNKTVATEKNKINEATEYTEYIVQKNDNLWIIAQKFYGDGHQFKKIAKDNNLKRPYEIFIGTKLIIYKNQE